MPGIQKSIDQHTAFGLLHGHIIDATAMALVIQPLFPRSSFQDMEDRIWSFVIDAGGRVSRTSTLYDSEKAA